ncbi:MAG: hypothetical protein ACR2KK_05190 [Acidimicrobiales bacterium]
MSLAVDGERLRFHTLSFLDEGGEYVIGRPDIDSYGVFPPDGAELVRQLQAGRTVPQAAAWYEQAYGERVDLDEFLTTLHELEFLRADGDEEGVLADGRQAVRWQRLGQLLFSRPAWVLYGCLVALTLALCIRDPGLTPSRQNIFFTRSLLVVELTLFGGQLPLTLVHELFHVLAGRRLGIRSRLRLSHRLYFLVFETVLDGLVAVPRRRRYLPMLAGMVADVLVMSGLTVIAAATRNADGDVSLLGGICLALAFTTLLRIAWQFYFYLRTDVYYLITTVLGCVDLHTTTKELLRNRLNRLLGRIERVVDEERWHPRDRRVARWYAPLAVAGYAISIAMFLLVFLPLMWRFMDTAITNVFLVGAGSSGQFWDSAGVLALTVAQLALVVGLALRERRQAARQRRRTVTTDHLVT